MQHKSDLGFYDSSKTKDKCAILTGKKVYGLMGSVHFKMPSEMFVKFFSGERTPKLSNLEINRS
jgi:hypothetical protein